MPSLPASVEPVLEIGKAEILREGQGVAIIAYGTMVEQAYEASKRLDAEGYDITVVNARFAKPFDGEVLRRLAERHHSLITAEEHVLQGGFGSTVVEHLADMNVSFSRVIRLGVPDKFQLIGPREKLLADCGLAVEDFTAAARELYNQAPAGTVETKHAAAEARTSRTDFSSPVS